MAKNTTSCGAREEPVVKRKEMRSRIASPPKQTREVYDAMLHEPSHALTCGKKLRLSPLDVVTVNRRHERPDADLVV
ncbi:hypothetical protein MN186_02575 [Aliiroseovarius sp. N1F302]|uniref:hypothetical protein n=1 Tax=Aliiroseovarius sediminis TaxID=2925839 RepID=UPI001F563EE3|nr:hypothetical protein [Aliiroseovarius sediminis]MCI2393352.1 hypothetical protein [Aliiroseovarius sediminis]